MAAAVAAAGGGSSQRTTNDVGDNQSSERVISLYKSAVGFLYDSDADDVAGNVSEEVGEAQRETKVGGAGRGPLS